MENKLESNRWPIARYFSQTYKITAASKGLDSEQTEIYGDLYGTFTSGMMLESILTTGYAGLKSLISGSYRYDGLAGSGIGNVYRDGSEAAIGSIGNKVVYTNPLGTQATWFEQHPNDIVNSIKASCKSKDVGKSLEGEIGELVQGKKKVVGFGKKIFKAEDNNIITDIDIETHDEIIECKSSIKAIKDDLEQSDRLTNLSNENYINPNKKKVIVFINKEVDMSKQYNIDKIKAIEAKGVTVIIKSHDKLMEALK